MLSRGRILTKRANYREGISPMESMVNLVDVMLVFICGLLISIIIFRNINVKNMVFILDQKELVEVENPEVLSGQLKDISTASDDVGSAVLDPRTGSIYVIDNKNKKK